MWLWQQNKAKKRLLVRIIGIIGASHVCLMLLLFVAYGRSAKHAFTVTTQKPRSGQRVVVLPFYKQKPKLVGVQRPAGTASAVSGMKRSAAQEATIARQKQQKETSLATARAKKQAHERAQKEAQQKKAAAKKAQELKHHKAIKKDAVKKKSMQKPCAKKPEPVTKKKRALEPKRTEQSPDLELKKIPEPVVPTPPAEQLEQVAEPIAPSVAHEIDVDAQTVDPDVLYMNKEEHDAYVMQEQIQQEVARTWRPPLGVAPGTQCIVTICVTWQGVIESCTIKEPSGILMFDMSVRASLKDMRMPRSSYGKEIMLTYR